MFANLPSSVVQTGVKSAGWEKRIAQLPPSHWWKSMSPCVVLAWKLGASEPRRRRGWEAGVARDLLNIRGARGVKMGLGTGATREHCDVARRALRENDAAIARDGNVRIE
jgi:hypothetical protein